MKDDLLEKLVPQVKHNSLVSDAQFWGYYTICGLLLRLREQYRFEKCMGPTEPIDQFDIGQWIGQREARWAELAETEFVPIELDGSSYDAFEAEAINEVIAPHGLLYGAGYGIYMKPIFFLADLDDNELIDGLEVFYAGREYVRDLSVHPAMLQERTVVARFESALAIMQEKFEELRATRGHKAIEAAFHIYGIGTAPDAEVLERMAHEELRTFVRHEVGEYLITQQSGGLWMDVLACSPQRRSCHFVRGLKDVLADTVTGGMLTYVIETRRAGSLALYTAMRAGYRKLLTPEIDEVFGEFLRTGDWKSVEEVRALVFNIASETAARLLDIYSERRDPADLESAVEAEIERLAS
jgi:hypothetical protein